MTGHPEWNFPAFFAAAKTLRAKGYEVVNPAEIEGDQNNWNACMREDIKHLMACDGVYMLKGWETSNGARLEYYLATTLGFKVLKEK